MLMLRYSKGGENLNLPELWFCIKSEFLGKVLFRGCTFLLYFMIGFWYDDDNSNVYSSNCNWNIYKWNSQDKRNFLFLFNTDLVTSKNRNNEKVLKSFQSQY